MIFEQLYDSKRLNLFSLSELFIKNFLVEK